MFLPFWKGENREDHERVKPPVNLFSYVCQVMTGNEQ